MINGQFDRIVFLNFYNTENIHFFRKCVIPNVIMKDQSGYINKYLFKDGIKISLQFKKDSFL